MSDGPPNPRDRGGATASVHAGEWREQEANAITTPIYQTSTFWFENSQEVIDYQEGRKEREEYGRYGNPTWAAVERKLNELEGGEASALFASGMCAATTTFMSLLPPGSHLIITSDCYRRTRQFIQQYLSRMSVETTVIDPADVSAFEAAIRDETALFFTESPTNPHLKVLDLNKLVPFAKEHRLKVLIDSTLATPINQRPLDFGVDLVLHSATKYLGGHNDLLLGSVCGAGPIVEAIREYCKVIGTTPDPNSSYLLIRGLKTLAVRMHRQNQTALCIARHLEAHSKVKRVFYPGLESHPDHQVAVEQMSGFGGLVSFEIDGGLDCAQRFVHELQLPYLAPSLGGVETLVSHPATVSYYDLSREERLALGITDELVRYAVGIEDCEDLVTDIDQALSKI